jgi:hypothetical protein
MAAPVSMNASMIATEGIRRAGIMRPSPEDISRASRIWIPELLSDICTRTVVTGNTRLKSLERQGFINLFANQRTYPLPADLEEEAVLTLLQAKYSVAPIAITVGGVNEVTIQTYDGIQSVEAYDEPIPFDEELGGRLLVHGPYVSEGSDLSSISEFEIRNATFLPGNEEENQADQWLLTLNEGAFPDVATAFGESITKISVVSLRGEQMHEVGWAEFDHHFSQKTGKPYYFTKNRGRLEIDSIPEDDLYYIHLRYFANPSLIDWADEPFPQIYSRWRHVLIPGIRTMMYFEKGDLDSYDRSKRDFDEQVENLIRKEVPYGGQFEGFTLGSYSGTGYGD